MRTTNRGLEGVRRHLPVAAIVAALSAVTLTGCAGFASHETGTLPAVTFVSATHTTPTACDITVRFAGDVTGLVDVDASTAHGVKPTVAGNTVTWTKQPVKGVTALALKGQSDWALAVSACDSDTASTSAPRVLRVEDMASDVPGEHITRIVMDGPVTGVDVRDGSLRDSSTPTTLVVAYGGSNATVRFDDGSTLTVGEVK